MNTLTLLTKNTLKVMVLMLTLMTSACANNQQTQAAVISDAELAQILAPIALYPDTLLTHILIASTYPLEIVQADRWLKSQINTDTQYLMTQAERQRWDPSVQALVAFPTVLERLNNDLSWTQDIGDAFLQDESRVLDSIQALRQQADAAKNLSNIENVKISRVKQRIIIESARPEIIYVPYYDTRVIYGDWGWYHNPPIHWPAPAYVHYRPNHRHIYWGTGVNINFNFYFSSVHWHSRRVYLSSYNPRYTYRTPYKVSVSSGSQRWEHQPQHRRGISYSHQNVSQRYNGHYESRRPMSVQSHSDRSLRNHSDRGTVERSRDVRSQEDRNHNDRSKDNRALENRSQPNRAQDGRGFEERNTRSENIRERLSEADKSQTNRDRYINNRDEKVMRTREDRPMAQTQRNEAMQNEQRQRIQEHTRNSERDVEQLRERQEQSRARTENNQQRIHQEMMQRQEPQPMQRRESSRQEVQRAEPVRYEAPRPEIQRQEVQRQEAPRYEAPQRMERQESPRREAPQRMERPTMERQNGGSRQHEQR